MPVSQFTASRPLLRALHACLLSAAAITLGGACRPSAEPAPKISSQPAAGGAVPSAKPAPGGRADFGAHRAPVTLHVMGPARVEPGQDVEIIVTVEQHVGDLAPVLLELTLPPGTHLISGLAQERLPPGNVALKRRYVVHVSSVPTADFQLVAQTGNPAFGARATGRYRFGRNAPTLATPPRSPNESIVGARNLGKPIQLQPK